MRIKELIPFHVRYIVGLFVATRIVLTLIGVISNLILSSQFPKPEHFSDHLWLDIWGVWDTGWYMGIAENGYSATASTQPDIVSQANYAFFPLYPMLMKILGAVVGDPFLAGIIISNIALLAGCFYLYKLALMDSDEPTALDSVKYLLVFPTAFIFSSVFTESLFLALLVSSFYYARKGNWLAAGILGFFGALTRSLGVIIIIPLAYEYLRMNKTIRRDFCFLFLIPLGTAVFAGYNYFLTGDFLAFAHVQAAWGHRFFNPLRVLWDGLFSTKLFNARIYAIFTAGYTTVILALFIIFSRRIRFAYWMIGIFLVLIPLCSGLQSLPRYILIIFPLYILMARISRNDYINQAITIILAVLQGFLMVFWSIGSPLII